jgi:hypothetical protein
MVQFHLGDSIARSLTGLFVTIYLKIMQKLEICERNRSHGFGGSQMWHANVVLISYSTCRDHATYSQRLVGRCHSTVFGV